MSSAVRPPSTVGRVFEHRFQTGELEGHALGNLLLVGLTEALGDLPKALQEAGRLVEAPPETRVQSLDPRAVSSRSAALGRVDLPPSRGSDPGTDPT